MKAFLLLGGVLYTAVIGWWLMDRLGHALDRGILSPYWDEAEEQAAKKEIPPEAGIPTRPNRCSKYDSNI